MGWKSIISFAAMIAATSAQLQIIDNNIHIVEPEQVTSNTEDHNNTFYDAAFANNISGNDVNGTLSSSEGLPHEGDEILAALPESPSSSDSYSSAVSSRQTRETSESGTYDASNQTTESNETAGSAEVLSVEKLESEEPPEDAPPVAASSEGDGGQNNQDITDEGNDMSLVHTTHGPVKGFQWHENTEIIAFYDIPYGTFKYLFEPSVTAQSWKDKDIHEATKHTKVCPQLDNDKYIGEINCLTLSIFTPKNAKNASVLFHIYDGHSNSKSADPLIYGPDYLVSKGVVLVLPNYRIGPMGFLCMQNETAPGNAGLKDLSLALEWVKDNVHLFGGNPANIGVSGDGAAGAYAGYLALCSRTKSYVSKVITESGSALSHWALDRNPIGTAYKLAEKLRQHHADGIIFNNTFDEMALETILKAAKGIRFMPCIEIDKEPFINDTPWKILQNKDIGATFMIGTATYAGTHEATEATDEYVEQINKHFDLLLPEDLLFKNNNERDKFAQQLRLQYFGNDSITVNDIDELSLWYTDASYLSPGIRLARPLSAAGATVYLYEFAFVGGLNWALEALKNPVQGAVRGDLVGYLFRKDGATVEDGSSEKRMIELMVDLWVSFINTGKPVAAKVEWREFKMAEDEEEEWLMISSEPKLKRGVHVERLRLWTSLYKHYFIENSAIRHSAHSCLALAVLICLMANNKLNYDRR